MDQARVTIKAQAVDLTEEVQDLRIAERDQMVTEMGIAAATPGQEIRDQVPVTVLDPTPGAEILHQVAMGTLEQETTLAALLLAEIRTPARRQSLWEERLSRLLLLAIRVHKTADRILAQMEDQAELQRSKTLIPLMVAP